MRRRPGILFPGDLQTVMVFEVTGRLAAQPARRGLPPRRILVNPLRGADRVAKWISFLTLLDNMNPGERRILTGGFKAPTN